jgi:hypothetical protein
MRAAAAGVPPLSLRAVVVVLVVIGTAAVLAVGSVTVPSTIVARLPLAIMVAVVVVTALGAWLASAIVVGIALRTVAAVLVALFVVPASVIAIAMMLSTLARRGRVAADQTGLDRGRAGGHALACVATARTAARSRGEEHENGRSKREDPDDHDFSKV